MDDAGATPPPGADERGTGGPRTTWAAAILAEHLLINGDPLAFAVADAASDAVAGEPLPGLAAAYSRARLLRIRSVAWAARLEPGDLAPYQQLYGEATALLLRYC